MSRFVYCPTKGAERPKRRSRQTVEPSCHGAPGRERFTTSSTGGGVDRFGEFCVAAHPEPAEEVILDVGATDDPLHGKQEGGVSPPKYSECLDFGVLPVTIAPNWFRVV